MVSARSVLSNAVATMINPKCLEAFAPDACGASWALDPSAPTTRPLRPYNFLSCKMPQPAMLPFNSDEQLSNEARSKAYAGHVSGGGAESLSLEKNVETTHQRPRAALSEPTERPRAFG
jgi:hypothetical protein